MLEALRAGMGWTERTILFKKSVIFLGLLGSSTLVNVYLSPSDSLEFHHVTHRLKTPALRCWRKHASKVVCLQFLRLHLSLGFQMFLSLERLIGCKLITILLINILLFFSANLSPFGKIHRCEVYIFYFTVYELATGCHLPMSFLLNKRVLQFSY